MNISKGQVENWFLKLDIQPEEGAYHCSVRKKFQGVLWFMGSTQDTPVCFESKESTLLHLVQLWSLLESFCYQHMLCLIFPLVGKQA